jgi:KUP system potassium uptake protein
VFAAFSPHHAFRFFTSHGYGGFVELGAIILVVTGAEALFADLGHFNAAAIRMSACGFVVPSLILAYMGQAAALILNYNDLVAAGWVPGTTDYPDGVSVVILNTFFKIVPSNWLVVYVLIATLASIIASQALISASFSLVHQAMRLQFFPRVTVIHTDRHQYGQIYIPEVNYALLVGILLVVAVAQNSAALAYAYGVTVSVVFVLTTLFFTVAIIVRFERHWLLAALFCAVYLVIDVAFLGANLLKFTTGAWFPVAVSIVVSLLMILWRWGRFRMLARQQALGAPDDVALVPVSAARVKHDDDDHPPLVAIASDSTQTALALALPSSSSMPRTAVPGLVIFCYTSVTDCVPALYMTFLRRVPVRPEVLVFVTITSVNVPRVADQLTVVPVPHAINVWRVTVTHGYAESPPSASKLALRLIGMLEPLRARARAAAGDDDVAVLTETTILAAVNPTFLLGVDTVLADPARGRTHGLLVWAFAFLLRLSRTAHAHFNIPAAMCLQVGVPIDI